MGFHTFKENDIMQIAVPNNIAAAALGGNTTVLGDVADAYTALKSAQQKAQDALLPDIAQVLADGLARPKATNGETATMRITEDGRMVVVLDGHIESLVEDAPAPVAAPPAPAPAVALTNGKSPSIGEIRKRAEAAGVNISDLDGRNQKDEMLARIERAENPKLAEVEEPEVEESEVEEAAPEEAAPEEPETPEAPDPEDVDSYDPEEELVESPANDENVVPVGPPEGGDINVDDWLE